MGRSQFTRLAAQHKPMYGEHLNVMNEVIEVKRKIGLKLTAECTGAFVVWRIAAFTCTLLVH